MEEGTRRAVGSAEWDEDVPEGSSGVIGRSVSFRMRDLGVFGAGLHRSSSGVGLMGGVVSPLKMSGPGNSGLRVDSVGEWALVSVVVGNSSSAVSKPSSA